MAKFRMRDTVVTAVRLLWTKWGEMCEHAGVGTLADGSPVGCYVDASGAPTDDANGRIGMRVPVGPHDRRYPGHALAVEGDWVVRMPSGDLAVYRPDEFELVFAAVDGPCGSTDATGNEGGPPIQETQETIDLKVELNRYAAAYQALGPLVGVPFDKRPSAEEAERIAGDVARLVNRLRAEAAKIGADRGGE